MVLGAPSKRGKNPDITIGPKTLPTDSPWSRQYVARVSLQILKLKNFGPFLRAPHVVLGAPSKRGKNAQLL